MTEWSARLLDVANGHGIMFDDYDTLEEAGLLLDSLRRALLKIIDEGSHEGGPSGSDGERMVRIAKEALGLTEGT